MKKRLISMLLAVLLVTSLMGGMSVGAYAADYSTVSYTIVKGDTLLQICNNLGLNFYTCQAAINKLNNISDAQYTKLRVGQTLTMPASNADGVKIAQSSISSGSSTGSGSNTSGGSSGNVSNANIAYWLIPYTIQRGETMVGVCNTLGINFNAYSEQIKNINGISSWNKVAAGKALLLPTNTAPAAGTSCYAVVSHKIAQGETVSSICNTYGISYSGSSNLLSKLNPNVSMNKIKYGNILLVPVPTVINSGNSGNSGNNNNNNNNNNGNSNNNGGSSDSGNVGKTYKLTASTSGGGSIGFTVNGKSATTAAAGSTVRVNVNPESGKGLESIKLKYADGSAVPVVSGSTFTMPECDVLVEAKFAGGYYMGVVSDHGTVSLYVNDVATSTASKGATVRVSVSPDTGYTIKRIYIQRNGGSYEVLQDNLSNNGSFTMPDCRVFVRVEYESRATYGLTKQGDLYGSFKLLVNAGEVTRAAAGATVQISPYNVTSGYIIDKVTVTDKNGKTVYSGTDTIFTMPASDVTVNVSFKQGSAETYDVNIQASSNGTVTANPTEAKKGTNVTLTATPNAGYELEYIKVKSDNGEAVYDTTTVSFTMPGSNVSVSASFKPVSAGFTEISCNDNTIGDISVSANGSVLTPGGSQAKVGDGINVSVVMKKDGYAVDTITLYYVDMNGNAQGTTVSNSFTLPACTSFSVNVKYKAQDNKLTVNSDKFGSFTAEVNGSQVTLDSNNKTLNIPTNGTVVFKATSGNTIKVEANIAAGLIQNNNSDAVTVKVPAGGATITVYVEASANPTSLNTLVEPSIDFGTSSDSGLASLG